MLAERLGEHATFLGWLGGTELARAYASADAFVFASQTDTFGQVLLEAQASGLPVLAVDRGGPASLIEHGNTGLLAEPEPGALAAALLSLTSTPLLRERLRRAALAAVRARTWEASLERLAGGYRRTLHERGVASARSVA
jgi:glycosyltransferase involved in cell wall biosynthesis